MISGTGLLARNTAASTARLGAALVRSAIRNGNNAAGSTTCACDAGIASSWGWTVASIGWLLIFSSLSRSVRHAHVNRVTWRILRCAPPTGYYGIPRFYQTNQRSTLCENTYVHDVSHFLRRAVVIVRGLLWSYAVHSAIPVDQLCPLRASDLAAQRRNMVLNTPRIDPELFGNRVRPQSLRQEFQDA